MYVYRDPELAAEAKDRDARDAAYWYDLSEEQPAPAVSGTRGPFEPLVSSGDVPPGTVPPADAAAAGEAPAGQHGEPAETAESRARKLEQIKDFYLTAEAIGEENVDKHFDELLAQQRELISEFFKRSGTAGGPGTAGPPGAETLRDQAAEQPRAW